MRDLGFIKYAILTIGLLLTIPKHVQAVEIETFCKDSSASYYGDVMFVIDNKNKIQVDLHQRQDQKTIKQLLASFNALKIKLEKNSSLDFEPVMAIFGYCNMKLKLPPAEKEEYKKIACEKIKPQKTSDLLDLALTAKTIASLSSGPETPEMRRLLSSKLDVTFKTELAEIFAICGDHLGSDDPVTPIPIKIEEEELPGVCLANPYSDLSNFLWKPVSEKDGRLVILTNPTTSLVVNGETLKDYGASNGRCSTARANSSGCNYGHDILVAVNTLSEFRIIKIPNGCSRYDCQNSLTSCGLESWDNNELLKLKKQRNKLKVRIQNTAQKNIKRKLQKKLRDANKILSYAKKFQA